MTSSSGFPFSSWISSPAFKPIRSASDPGSTASTRRRCPSSPRCAGASRYSCTALWTYAEAENCFFVTLVIRIPLTQAAGEIVQTGERGHETRHIEKNIQFGHDNVAPVDVQHREDGQDLHHGAGLAVWRRLEYAPADHENHNQRYQENEDV